MISEEQALIDKLKADIQVNSYPDWCAYIMATVKHETAGTFRPIAEYGKGVGRPYGAPNPSTRQTYYGRGYVQLTWKENYDRFGKLLGIDLVNNPDLAMEPDIAYKIMIYGMILGLFTGVGLDHYLNDKGSDYINARRIINGTDKAELIASYAEQYEKQFDA